MRALLVHPQLCRAAHSVHAHTEKGDPLTYWKVSIDLYVDPTKYIADGDEQPQPNSQDGADAVVGAALAGLCPLPYVDFRETTVADTLPPPLAQAILAQDDRGKVIPFPLRRAENQPKGGE